MGSPHASLPVETSGTFHALKAVGSALKIFESINQRGVGLNSADLLKNLQFTQVKPDEFTRPKDERKKVTALLERNTEKPLQFLRDFIMANYKVKNQARGCWSSCG